MPEMNRLGEKQFFGWGSILWVIEPGNLDIERMSEEIRRAAGNSCHHHH